MKKRHRQPDAVTPVIVEVKSPDAAAKEIAARIKEVESAASGRRVPASAAGECVMCKGYRKLAGRVNYTEIYCSRGTVSYCRCLVCKYTWKVTG